MRPGEIAHILRPVNLKAAKGEEKLPAGVAAIAKTGTLNFVRGLAGYIDTAQGRRLAFAIFSEDLQRRASAAEPAKTSGSRGWRNRARALERRLVRDWALVY